MIDFSNQFRKLIMRYKRIGYNLNVMLQSACLVINPITVDGYAVLFNCTPVDRASDFIITKTSPCNEHPLTPHFYKVKLGFTGVYIFFLILAPKHRCLSKNKKTIIIFHLKSNIFTAVKYCCILHGQVCVM